MSILPRTIQFLLSNAIWEASEVLGLSDFLALSKTSFLSDFSSQSKLSVYWARPQASSFAWKLLEQIQPFFTDASTKVHSGWAVFRRAPYLLSSLLTTTSPLISTFCTFWTNQSDSLALSHFLHPILLAFAIKTSVHLWPPLNHLGEDYHHKIEQPEVKNRSEGSVGKRSGTRVCESSNLEMR